MVQIGNFLFHYRNALFPIVFLLLFVENMEFTSNDTFAVSLGLAVAGTGQLLRAITIGLTYIKRSGAKRPDGQRQVYADQLIIQGLFAHSRNPLYLGNVLIILGLGLVANSLPFLLIGILFFILAYTAIVAAEENYLRQKFGTEFDAYCQRVRRFVPDFSGFGKTWSEMEFKWRRLVVVEYGSTYAWMAAVCALLIQDRWMQTRSFSDQQVQMLCGALVLATAACLVARYLKKARILVAD